MSEELALYEPQTDITVARPPQEVLNEAMTAAKALQTVVAGKSKPVVFNGEQYLEYEDWQTVARFYGITAKVVTTEFVDYGGVTGFVARAEAIRKDGMIASAAEAMCMSDEPNWKIKPLFQLRSMAQTRACAKALRNCLAWVVVLAGYRATPAEEIQDMINGNAKPPVQQPKPKQTTAGESSVIEALIEDVQVASGEKNGKPWTKYGIVANGNTYGTFDKTIGELATEYIGNFAEIHFERNGKYLNATALIPIETADREPGQDG